jgi:hypothetical protein
LQRSLNPVFFQVCAVKLNLLCKCGEISFSYLPADYKFQAPFSVRNSIRYFTLNIKELLKLKNNLFRSGDE